MPFKDGRPEGYYENFATGFWAGENRAEVWGRPAALAVARRCTWSAPGVAGVSGTLSAGVIVRAMPAIPQAPNPKGQLTSSAVRQLSSRGMGLWCRSQRLSGLAQIR